MVGGTFPGTKDFCGNAKSYKIGLCGYSKYAPSGTQGIKPVEFTKFDGRKICIKRNFDFNYHKLANMRDSNLCADSTSCGS